MHIFYRNMDYNIDDNIIWKDVKGYEGIYKVSNTGEVLTVDHHHSGKSKIRSQQVNRCGYKTCALGKGIRNSKMFLVHRLVALAFLPTPDNPELFDVDHINGDRIDNRPENLRWCTHSDNIKFSSMRGKYNYTDEQKQKMRDDPLMFNKKKCMCIETGMEFISYHKAAEWLRSIGYKKANYNRISKSIKEKRKVYYKYTFVNA